MIRRIMMAALACMMIVSTCMAESDDAKQLNVLNATENFYAWREKLQECAQVVSDEDSLFIIEQVVGAMTMMESMAYNSLSVLTGGENVSQTISGMPVYSYEEIEEPSGTSIALQTDATRGTSGRIYACSATYREDYYRMKMQAWSMTGEPVSFQQTEIAEKDGEILLVHMQYTNEMNIIARFATHITSEDAATIYVQVFGDETDIVLSPKAWCEGEQEIGSWEKSLLYARQ